MERRRAGATQGYRIDDGKDQFDRSTDEFDHGARGFDINGGPGKFNS